MKKIIFSVLITLCFQCLYSQSHPIYFVQGFIKKEIAKKNNVKSEAEYTCKYLYGKPDTLEAGIVYREYNKDGNITLETNNYTERFYRKFLFTYNEFGNIIEQKRFRANNNLNVLFNYSYDIARKISEVREYNNKGVYVDNYIYKYDTLNRLVKVQKQKDEYYYCLYSYDYSGRIKTLHTGKRMTDNLIEYEVEYNDNDNISRLSIFTDDEYTITENIYTEQNKILQSIETNQLSDGTIENQYKYSYYCENELLIEKTKYDMKTNEPIELVKYKYSFY